MRIVLVLSQITYVPDNCYNLAKKVLTENRTDIAGLVILQNFSLDIILKIIWLYCVGCPRIATSLLTNSLHLFTAKKEKLFKDNDLPVLKVKSMNEPEIIKWVKDEQIDCIVNVRTRCIFKKEILRAPKLGCFNIHHGILPTYRGMFCDLYALFENRPAGITLHRMNERIDDGDIIFTKKISRTGEKNYLEYLSRTGTYEAEAIKKLINQIKNNQRYSKRNSHAKVPTIYTKTPSLQTIRDMQKAGILL